MDDPRSKIVPGGPSPGRSAPRAVAGPSTRRTVHSPAPHARTGSAPGTAAVLRGTEPRAPRVEGHSPLPPPPLPPGERPEAVLLEPSAADDTPASRTPPEAALAARVPPAALLDPLGLPELPESSAADEPTHDLPPPPPALRVALNRPISLADVRAVRSEQSAIASESTYVGPPE